jgi:hemerythrin-like domain-containing protein
MKSTTQLSEDHLYILRALSVLEQMSAQARRGTRINDADIESLIVFFRAFADRHHQGKEEGVFFPALLKDQGQKHYRDLCALVFEHNRERFLIEGIEDAVRFKKQQYFPDYAERLVRVLRAHIESEEHELFKLAEETLSSAEDEQVAFEMRNYEWLWQQQAIPALIHRLEELEAQYLPLPTTACATA